MYEEGAEEAKNNAIKNISKIKAVMVFHGLSGSCRDRTNLDGRGQQELIPGMMTSVKELFSQYELLGDVPVVGVSSGKSYLPKTPMEVIENTREGVKFFLNDHENINSDELLLIGFSMGAYASISLASDPEFAKTGGFWGAIPISPPTSAYDHIDYDNQYGEKSALAELSDSCGLKDFLKESLNSSKLLNQEEPLHTHMSIILDVNDKHLLERGQSIQDYYQKTSESTNRKMDTSNNRSLIFLKIIDEGQHAITDEKLKIIIESIRTISLLPKEKKQKREEDIGNASSCLEGTLEDFVKTYQFIVGVIASRSVGYYTDSNPDSKLNQPLDGERFVGR